MGPQTGIKQFYQQVGTFNSGDETIYRLSATLGDRSNQTFGALDIAFYSVDSSDTGIAADGSADGTTNNNLFDVFSTEQLLATHITPVVDGGAGTATLSYSHNFSFNSTNLADGDEIWLSISFNDAPGGGQQSLIDDITLVAIPEPSTGMLFALAGITFFVFRNSRRRHP